MTPSDREASEARIHQLISDIHTQLGRLQYGIDQTRHVWRGGAANESAASMHAELVRVATALEDAHAVIDYPPWK